MAMRLMNDVGVGTRHGGSSRRRGGSDGAEEDLTEVLDHLHPHHLVARHGGQDDLHEPFLQEPVRQRRCR